MDIQQLKLLAARLRGLLQQSECQIGHNQSLDIAASLVGLRNWPEVLSFPDRVTAALLDNGATSRLAFRIKSKFGLEFSQDKLLAALAPDTRKQAELPQIWPTGPAPGVYVTTDQKAIDALVTSFLEATDGALVYAEEAASFREGVFNLGENGLWSYGLDRVSSGTLLVVGPLNLEQGSWDDSAQHLRAACGAAYMHGHRVAVLLRTPDPDRVCEDAHLMARSDPKEAPGAEDDLVGIVSEGGELIARTPFAQPGRSPALRKERKHRPAVGAIPERVRTPLAEELKQHRSGIVLVGTGTISEHSAIALVEDVIGMTEHAGPVARIMPRTRSTYSKYFNVPESVRELPFLPSVESAYDQGFRRMVLYANYSEAELYLAHPDVLFIGSTWGSQVTSVHLNGTRVHSRGERDILEQTIAIVAVTALSSAGASIGDLYLRRDNHFPSDAEYDELMSQLASKRVIRWERELAMLLASSSSIDIQGAIKDERLLMRMFQDFLSELGDIEDPHKLDALEVITALKEKLLGRGELLEVVEAGL